MALSEVYAGTIVAETEALGLTIAELSSEWQRVADLASDAERHLLVGLAALGTVPIPTLGFETEDGTPLDVSWPDMRIAVDMDIDEATRRDLVVADWTLLEADPGVIGDAFASRANWRER